MHSDMRTQLGFQGFFNLWEILLFNCFSVEVGKAQWMTFHAESVIIQTELALPSTDIFNNLIGLFIYSEVLWRVFLRQVHMNLEGFLVSEFRIPLNIIETGYLVHCGFGRMVVPVNG